MFCLAWPIDTTDGILNIGPDGRIYTTMGAVFSSSLAPIAALINPTLPDGLTVVAPQVRLQIFIPQL